MKWLVDALGELLVERAVAALEEQFCFLRIGDNGLTFDDLTEYLYGREYPADVVEWATNRWLAANAP